MEGIRESLLASFVDAALREDIKDGDHTSLACIDEKIRDEAYLLVKDEGVIAGIDFAEYVFKRLDPECTFERFIKDGDEVVPGDKAFEVSSTAQILLKGERLVLNTMQRLSGVSTLSSKFSKKGCTNYRDGLYAWIMIKDNHIDACGSITEAITKVNTYLNEKKKDLGITVEVRNLSELQEVLDTGQITRIMLDNFDIETLEEAVELIDKKFESEASGGVNLDTVREIAETGVDFISVGALTHSAGSLDMSLKIKSS